jgi:hypothetical protein
VAGSHEHRRPKVQRRLQRDRSHRLAEVSLARIANVSSVNCSELGVFYDNGPTF